MCEAGDDKFIIPGVCLIQKATWLRILMFWISFLCNECTLHVLGPGCSILARAQQTGTYVITGARHCLAPIVRPLEGPSSNHMIRGDCECQDFQEFKFWIWICFLANLVFTQQCWFRPALKRPAQIRKENSIYNLPSLVHKEMMTERMVMIRCL